VFNLFKRRRNGLLGVDISSSSVKILELEAEGDSYKVSCFGMALFPGEAVVEKDIRDIEAVARTVKEAHALSGSHSHFAAVAVSGSSVITKIIQMDADLLDHEIETQIRAEADRHISYPIEEMNVDFEVLGVNESDPKLVDVLIAAARSENVQAHVEALVQGGLHPKVVSVEIYAIERAYSLIARGLPDQGKGLTAVVVDIGDETSTFCVLSSGRTIYIRDEAFGGYQLTKQVMKHYNMSEQEAEKAKRSNTLPEDYEANILLPFQQDLLQQINRSLEFFSTSEQHRVVDLILLAGGCAKIPGLIEQVAKVTNIKTMLANPIEHLSIAPGIDKESLIAKGPQLLIACGLAMRGFDDVTH
jgi:type IV pilus assembly protein PilM